MEYFTEPYFGILGYANTKCSYFSGSLTNTGLTFFPLTIYYLISNCTHWFFASLDWYLIVKGYCVL